MAHGRNVESVMVALGVCGTSSLFWGVHDELIMHIKVVGVIGVASSKGGYLG